MAPEITLSMPVTSTIFWFYFTTIVFLLQLYFTAHFCKI